MKKIVTSFYLPGSKYKRNRIRKKEKDSLSQNTDRWKEEKELQTKEGCVYRRQKISWLKGGINETE